MRSNNPKPHFHVTAGLIWKMGKILITKRPKGSHLEGLWEFPGGKQEKGESLEQCLEREIMEELGIKVRVEDVFLRVDHEYNTKKISLHAFNCAHLSGKPRALQGQEIMWINPVELPKLSFPPPDREIILHL